MDTSSIYELVGYIASTIIVISMMISSLVGLRIVNSLGAVLFAVYGILIDAYPVSVLNTLVVIINIYQLYRLNCLNKSLKIIQIPATSEYLDNFLEFHKNDLSRYSQLSKKTLSEIDTCILTLRKTNLVGVVLGKTDENHRLNVTLDYVEPQYHGVKIRQHLYVLNKQYFKDKGFTSIVVSNINKTHAFNLRQVGFLETGNNTFEIKL